MATRTTEKLQRGIQSIEVGGALLKALATADGPLSLGELARLARLSPAKAHPYLVSYANLGLVVQDSTTARYDFGPMALAVGLASLRRLNPLRLASEKLPNLVSQSGLTAALAVWGSHGATVVHIVESARPLHVNLRVGSVMSLASTATGQVFAAFMPQAEVEAALARERGAGDATVGGGLVPASDEATLDQIRKRRLARTIDRPLPGISAFSAPVLDHRGTLVLAVTLVGPSPSFDAGWSGTLASALGQFATDISASLGARN